MNSKKINKEKFNNGMTLPEVSIALMVMVIFFGALSLSAKYFQSNLKSSSINKNEKDSWLKNEHKILSAMDKWSEILSQPSFSRDFVANLDCKYNFKNEDNFWNLPGKTEKNLPKTYKYCVIPTLMGESSLYDLNSNADNAKPGIYLIYAIPDKISPTAKPLRKLMCRPITYC